MRLASTLRFATRENRVHGKKHFVLKMVLVKIFVEFLNIPEC